MNDYQPYNMSPGFTHQQLMLDIAKKIIEARANDEILKFFHYVDQGLKIGQVHLDIQTRELLNEDRKILIEKLLSIKSQSSLNDETRKKRLLALKESFADTHEHYVMKAVTKACLKIEDEGIIDVDEKNLEAMRAYIQEKTVPKAIEKYLEVKDQNDADSKGDIDD